MANQLLNGTNISEGSNEVSQSIQNVARAHEQSAQVDQQQMVTAGQIGSEISSTADSLGRVVAKQEYYNNVDTVNNIVGGLSNATINARAQYSSTNSLTDLANQNQAFTNQLNGASKSLKTADLPKTFSDRAQDKIDYFKQLNQDNYTKRVQYVGGQALFNNLNNNVTSMAESAGNQLPDISNMLNSSKQLLENPSLTTYQRNYVTRVLKNINQLNPNQHQNAPLQANGDNAVTSTYTNLQSNRSADNMIKSMFINGSKFMGAAGHNLSMDPIKFGQMLSQGRQLNDTYNYLANSKHLGESLNNLRNSNNPLNQRVSHIISPMLNKGLGAAVIRGMNPNVRHTWQLYQQNPTSQTLQDADDAQNSAAVEMGIPLSHVSSLSPNMTQEVQAINGNYKDPNYQANLASVLQQYSGRMGNQPIYGINPEADTVRLYHYGNQNNPDMASFVGNFNPHVQKDVDAEFSAKGGDKSVISSYMANNSKSIDALSSMIQVPTSQINNLVATQLKMYLNSGVDGTDATARMNKLMQGYTNSNVMDIGDNYTLYRGTLLNLGINKAQAPEVINHAISIAMNNQINDSSHKPEGMPEQAYRTRVSDTLGNESDYTLISSNGATGNLYAKNNINGMMVPISHSMMVRAAMYVKGGDPMGVDPKGQATLNRIMDR